MITPTERARHDEPRLYGNWRPERGWGVGALSTTATVTVFVAVVAPLIAVTTAPIVAPALAAVAAVVIAALVVRVGGVSAADVVTRRVRFHRARRAGWTRLSGGVLTDHPRAADLPGVLLRCGRWTSTTGAAPGTPCSGTGAPAP